MSIPLGRGVAKTQTLVTTTEPVRVICDVVAGDVPGMPFASGPASIRMAFQVNGRTFLGRTLANDDEAATARALFASRVYLHLLAAEYRDGSIVGHLFTELQPAEDGPWLPGPDFFAEPPASPLFILGDVTIEASDRVHPRDFLAETREALASITGAADVSDVIQRAVEAVLADL